MSSMHIRHYTAAAITMCRTMLKCFSLSHWAQLIAEGVVCSLNFIKMLTQLLLLLNKRYVVSDTWLME